MKNKILAILFLVAILFTTVVYSAYNTQLQIKGEAMVRSIQKIRITNITIYERINGAYETYNNRYNKDVTFMYATLPVNSSIAYEVEITNEDTIGYLVESITEQAHTNPNVDISISLNVNDSIRSQNTKTFIIRFTNNTTEEQLDTLIYKYAFKEDKFTIQYNLNGGSVSGSNRTTYSTTDTDFLLNNPTRSGYKFAGWTGTDLSERTLNITIDTASAKNLSYTANWKQQVSVNKVSADCVYTCSEKALLVYRSTGHLDLLVYNSNTNVIGGNSVLCFKLPTWNTTNGQDDIMWYRVDNGNFVNTPNMVKMNSGTGTYRGFYYNKYYWTQTRHTNVSGHIAMHSYDCADSPLAGYDYSLYYYLYYNGNGGTSSKASNSYRLNDGDADFSVSATRSGYTLLGWSETTDGNILTGLQMGAANVTVYAQWAKTNN